MILLGLLLEMAFSALLPFSFRTIVDDGLLGGDHTLLAWIVGVGAVSAIAVSAAGLGRDYLYARLVARVLADLRHTMFTKLQRLSLDFYGRTRVGDILYRFSGDLAAVEFDVHVGDTAQPLQRGGHVVHAVSAGHSGDCDVGSGHGFRLASTVRA